jgi:hypothetical protein
MAGVQSGANSFSLNLARFAARAGVEMKQVVQKISMEAYKRIIYRTPVDTGRARANWGCTIGQPRAAIQIESTDKSGGATVAAMTGTVQQFPGDGSLFLVNNLAYIGVLESGDGSKQAPEGMVRVTMAEMAGFLGSKATIDSLKKATK